MQKGKVYAHRNTRGGWYGCRLSTGGSTEVNMKGDTGLVSACLEMVAPLVNCELVHLRDLQVLLPFLSVQGQVLCFLSFSPQCCPSVDGRRLCRLLLVCQCVGCLTFFHYDHINRKATSLQEGACKMHPDSYIRTDFHQWHLVILTCGLNGRLLH